MTAQPALIDELAEALAAEHWMRSGTSDKHAHPACPICSLLLRYDAEKAAEAEREVPMAVWRDLGPSSEGR